VTPQQKSARDYFRDSLDIVAEADKLGFTHVRTVEHYFQSYGGYSPNPIVFLSAASQRTRHVRLVTDLVPTGDVRTKSHPSAGSRRRHLVKFRDRVEVVYPRLLRANKRLMARH
jgi:hypothetical protein